MGNGRRTPSEKSSASGRILGAVGIAMIAIVVIGVIFVFVNRPEVGSTTAAPASAGQPSSSQPPTTKTARAQATAPETPIANEHSHAPDDSDTEDSDDADSDDSGEKPKQKRTPTPSPSPTPTAEPTPSPLQAPPKITEANLPTGEDLAWQQPGDWTPQTQSGDFGDQPPSVCLPSVTVLGNPTTMLRRDYTRAEAGHATALVIDYATADRAEAAYLELGRSVRDCPQALRQQGYLQPSPVAAKQVPLPEGIGAEHLRLGYTPRDGQATAESIGLVRAGHRVLMLSMVTPAADNSWAKDPDGKTQSHPMLRSLPTAAGRLVA